ncbi:MAG: hypothetical protein AAF357_03210 [Verrucomicrobiota bacterium]
MNSNIAPQAAQEDAVVRLKCPECSGGLNLRRKHLGISGKCVHCKTPITAVEEAGVITLRRSAEVEAARAVATPSAPVENTPPTMEAPSAAEEEAGKFIPPAMPEAVAQPVPERDQTSEEPASTWGFPKRDEAAIPAPVEEDPAPAKGNEPPSMPASFSDLPTGEPSSLMQEPASEKAIEMPAHSGEETTELPGGFGFQEPPAIEAETPAPKEETATAAPSLPVSDPTDLFESKNESPGSALFSNGSGSGEVNAGWGAKVPDQNHASISPFSTGSAEPDPGFAETLFREKAKEETGKIQAKSPFGELDGEDQAPLASGALFSSPVAPKAAPAEPEKEVILDGDGRPLRETTPEEKEQFANDIMHFGDYKKRSPWLKRIVKFFVTIGVLAGIGYAAYVFMPEDQVEVAKAKVFDWLEPGSVLMDYLPFEVGESEDGEKEVKIKALEGLDNLSNQMDQYLSTAEDQLNSTLAEGAEGYKREAPVDMPEMPKMPKIPGLKIPGLPTGDTETEEGVESAE